MKPVHYEIWVTRVPMTVSQTEQNLRNQVNLTLLIAYCIQAFKKL